MTDVLQISNQQRTFKHTLHLFPDKSQGVIATNAVRLKMLATFIRSTVLSQGGGGTLQLKIRGGGWLDSLASGILVGKRYFGVLQKY